MKQTCVLTENLTKKYGEVTAVQGVNLAIESGTITGLIGPNGAGKTTLINMLMGIYVPSSGTISILGKSYQLEAIAIKKCMGAMPEGLGLYELLTGEEYLHFVGYAYGLHRAEIKDRATELMEFMELIPVCHKPIYQYSQGMKKKLAMSGIFLHEPQVILLDEPFENIDPVSARKIQQALAVMATNGSTVIITSHMLSTVEQHCSDVALMVKGEIVFTAPTDQIRSTIKDHLTREVYENLEDLFMSFVETKIVDSTKRYRLSWLSGVRSIYP